MSFAPLKKFWSWVKWVLALAKWVLAWGRVHLDTEVINSEKFQLLGSYDISGAYILIETITSPKTSEKFSNSNENFWEVFKLQLKLPKSFPTSTKTSKKFSNNFYENFLDVFIEGPRILLRSFQGGLKTSWKFRGRLENFSEVFGEVIVSIRIYAPEMS